MFWLGFPVLLSVLCCCVGWVGWGGWVVVVGQRLRNKTGWHISPLSVDGLFCGHLVACVCVVSPFLVVGVLLLLLC